MRTADGSRKRTAGGVFFFLLREYMAPDAYKALMKADKKRKDRERDARFDAQRRKRPAAGDDGPRKRRDSRGDDSSRSRSPSDASPVEPYVVQKYVERPLLIGGKKFDLRLYVVVTSFRPLRAFVSRLGFARFCAAKYVASQSARGDLGDRYAHLTNVAVQKKNAEYNAAHGGKWSLRNLRLFLESARGADATARLFAELDAVILKSLRAVQNVMHNDPHCFELYGYDMLIDDSLKPWLIEVNASPSLSATTDDDRDVKLAVIRDALAAAVPESFPFGDPGLDENANSVGSLDLLVDDAADAAARERARERSCLLYTSPSPRD